MGSMRGKTDWRKMALIEIDEESPDLTELISESPLRYELRKSASAPAGYLWLDLLVDGSDGEYFAARTARTVLVSLERLARMGVIRTLRIVTGKEWLDVGATAQSSIIEDTLPF